MKKSLITLFIIFLAITTSTNFVSAQNETEEMLSTMNNDKEEACENEVKERKIENETKAQENGNYNITFNNGYNGYCVDYGDHEAGINDTFILKDTSNIVNENTGESVGNYLKVFFVDFYDVAIKDKIVTQHIIWHFTDDFENWRINPDLIKEIKLSASNKEIPDSGFVLKINNTTEALFNFIMLDSTKSSNHQNFFGYKINYRAINENTANTSSQNKTNQTNNTNSTYLNEITNQSTTKTKEITINEKSKDLMSLEKNVSESKPYEFVNLKKHVSGNSIIGILLLSILSCFIAVKYVRD